MPNDMLDYCYKYIFTSLNREELIKKFKVESKRFIADWVTYGSALSIRRERPKTVFCRNLNVSDILDFYEIIPKQTYYIKRSELSLDTDAIKDYYLEHSPSTVLDDGVADFVDEAIIELTGAQLLELTKTYGKHIEKIYEELI